MDGGPAPKESTHPGSKWHHARLCKTSHIPISTAAWSWESSSAVLSLQLIMSLHHPAVSALGCSTSARTESRVALMLRPAASGSNLAAGRTVFCRPCLPIPGAQGFLLLHHGDTARDHLSKFHCTLLTQGPLSKPGFGDRKLSLKIWNSSQELPLPPTLFYLGQLPMMQVLHFPSSHCTGVHCTGKCAYTTAAPFSDILSLSSFCFS